jgi:hypothetical protein
MVEVFATSLDERGGQVDSSVLHWQQFFVALPPRSLFVQFRHGPARPCEHPGFTFVYLNTSVLGSLRKPYSLRGTR